MKTLYIVGGIAAVAAGAIYALRKKPTLCEDTASATGLPPSFCGPIEAFVKNVSAIAPSIIKKLPGAFTGVIPGVRGGEKIGCPGYGELSAKELSELEKRLGRKAGVSSLFPGTKGNNVMRDYCDELRNGGMG